MLELLAWARGERHVEPTEPTDPVPEVPDRTLSGYDPHWLDDEDNHGEEAGGMTIRPIRADVPLDWWNHGRSRG